MLLSIVRTLCLCIYRLLRPCALVTENYIFSMAVVLKTAAQSLDNYDLRKASENMTNYNRHTQPALSSFFYCGGIQGDKDIV